MLIRIHALRAVLLFVLAGVTVGGCDRSDSGSSATSPATSSTATGVVGPRLVSTVPAATLMLQQMGAGDRLVGISTYDRDVLPEPQRSLPVVGDYFNLNYETVLSLKPTVVIIQMADDRLAPRLKEITTAHSVQLINMKLQHIGDIFKAAKLLGEVTGREAGAQRQIDLAQGQLAALEKRWAGPPAVVRPKVLYIIGKGPVFIVGGQRFLDEMITLAGGTNVGATVGPDFPEVNREIIIKLAPEVILIAAPGEADTRDPSDPRLKTWLDLPTPAGANKRVYLVTDPNSQLASLEVAAQTMRLAQLIHPEVTEWAPATSSTTLPATSPAATGRSNVSAGPSCAPAGAYGNISLLPMAGAAALRHGLPSVAPAGAYRNILLLPVAQGRSPSHGLPSVAPAGAFSTRRLIELGPDESGSKGEVGAVGSRMDNVYEERGWKWGVLWPARPEAVGLGGESIFLTFRRGEGLAATGGVQP